MIVMDVHGNLSLANEHSRALFGLTRQDIGRPLQDLDISYKPVELRSCIDQAYQERRAVYRKDVMWAPSTGEIIFFDVEVRPLMDAEGSVQGAGVSFTDITSFKKLQAELQHSNQELETAYEELQSTHEELETTNEELQSSNEELETTNEELQSTNEELETMNEELLSTNVEMETANTELILRSEELNQVNAFLQSVLASLRDGVVVVDSDFQVLAWNMQAEDLWGLRAYEVQGKNFLNLDIGLPIERLKQPIRACLSRKADCQEILLEATNRRGKAIVCRVVCTPLVSAKEEIRGVILLMQETDKRAS
jgi:two-component system CheB/CheR fusion protein